MQNQQVILDAYLTCMLWAETDYNGDPLDDNYTDSNIAPSAIKKSRKAILKFIDQAGPLLDGMDDAQVGHDLWLTRNGHGAGFWDRGLGGRGDRLSDIARAMGECSPYVSDDGLIHV